MPLLLICVPLLCLVEFPLFCAVLAAHLHEQWGQWRWEKRRSIPL